ncbi:GGDEF domain-containing protein [Deinococcus marmoris]|uniref:Diguanylate cyclase/phosphodiesterase (GGDEF & EAL domains) with PAS/PAC sensor(S) n=1 Tax=Deinococcus marmoris TaxID=249408 RepID=A0A1U7P157_9DEIO|nr:GGDEF domain-containing protein [Deinococcus marmoris]OLV18894.1 diguanylate cyclase/phosphodiesterase (GGDEF & EAL domains) with PAS/PAC sensor(s) [Deinococcus marmoris]
MTDNDTADQPLAGQPRGPEVSSPDSSSAGTSALRDELHALQVRGADPDSTAAMKFLAYRDAAYLALDLRDLKAAMEHALNCLLWARASGDGRLQVKAHVTLALAMMQTYDDAGAQREFGAALTLAEAIADARGVALVAINTSHFELERRNYPQAAQQLLKLLHAPAIWALLETGTQDTRQLWEIFHINFVVSASETLLAGTASASGAVNRPEIERQLAVSAALLAVRLEDRHALSLLETAALLDALVRHTLWTGELTVARTLADEHVQLTSNADFPLLYGRALLDRSRVSARIGDLENAILDAGQAVGYFHEAASELWEARSREQLAAIYARAGRYREAYETQQEVTQGVENLYRDYHQQRALVRQIAQQAREAEVRAEALAEAALRDPLTGAPNRTRAMQVLADLHTRARQDRPSAVALLDLDLFKRVNDTFGHLVGDAVLTGVTRLLSAELRDQDLLARLGGEEFIVILPDVTAQQAETVCLRLRDSLQSASWETLAPGLMTTGSFGVAVLDGGQDITSVLMNADQALYAAKAAGRNAVRVTAKHADITRKMQPYL